MIAQIIGFTRHLLKEWNNRVSPTESSALFVQRFREGSSIRWGMGARRPFCLRKIVVNDKSDGEYHKSATLVRRRQG